VYRSECSVEEFLQACGVHEMNGDAAGDSVEAGDD
jgi:hypothetical protein